MLTMTPTAATVLTNVRSERGAPGTFGVRFFAAQSPTSDKAGVAFDFVESPEPTDTVTSEAGLKTYVAPEVDEMMGDVVVDVETVDQQTELVMRRPMGDSS